MNTSLYKHTRRFLVLAMALAFAGSLLPGAFASEQDSPPALAEKQGQAAANPEATEFVPLFSPDRPLTPMMLDIKSAWENKHAEIDALTEQMKDAPDELAALNIQRRIEDMYFELEIQVLRIQMDHARAAGRLDTVQEIESAIEKMTAPKPEPQPRERQAPSQG